MAHLGNGPVRVVCHREDQDGDAAGAVTLVRDLLILDSLELSRTLLHGALDVLLRHRRRARSLDCGAKTRITGGIASAELGRHRDLANELGEMRAPFRICGRFVMLDLLPLAVTSHSFPIAVKSCL